MGRPWNPNFAEGDADSGKMPLEQIAETFVKFVGFVEPLLTSLLDSQTSSHSDDLGFKPPAEKRLIDYTASGFADKFLAHLLRLMSLVFSLNRDYRRNIQDFSGRYLFRVKDRNIALTADFDKGRMKVYEEDMDNTDVTVTFRNPKALMRFLLSPKPDVLGSILKQDVVIDGNLNYLLKFAYMIKRLQRMVTGRA
jgi:hypothetical protein